MWPRVDDRWNETDGESSGDCLAGSSLVSRARIRSQYFSRTFVSSMLVAIILFTTNHVSLVCRQLTCDAATARFQAAEIVPTHAATSFNPSACLHARPRRP